MKREEYIRLMPRKKSTKRLDNAYENYLKRYKAKQKSIRKRGYEMADSKLSRREYEMVRKAYVDKGVKTNINQTIVADQTYEYSQKTARQFKKVAEEYNLEWKNKSITELRKGEVDVSGINDLLKQMYPDWTGTQRQQYISYEVFGSE